MNQLNRKYLMIGAVLIGILLLLFFVLTPAKGGGKQKEDEKNKGKKEEPKVVIKKPINPSGTFLLFQLMRTYDNTANISRFQTSYHTSLRKELPKKSKNGLPNVYFAITEDWDLDYDDYEYLDEFVEEGNIAFIAAEDFSYDILNEFTEFPNDLLKRYYDTTIVANFYHPDLKQNLLLNFKNSQLNLHGFPKYKNWVYMVETSLYENTIKLVYNTTEDYPIAIMIDKGEGKLIIHTSPDAFSNANMLLKDGKKHAELLFSHFPKSNIYWHNDYGKYSPYRGVSQPQFEDDFGDDEERRSSPLQYIIQEPILLTAFILIVIGIVLYMLIQTKRRQRIIPPIEANTNTTIEFVDTVSKLYFQQHRHDKLIAHLEQLFLAYIRHHYYLTSPKITEDFVRRVSEKSGITEQRIASIFKGLRLGKNNKSSTEADLIDIYNKLNYFYKNCN